MKKKTVFALAATALAAVGVAKFLKKNGSIVKGDSDYFADTDEYIREMNKQHKREEEAKKLREQQMARAAAEKSAQPDATPAAPAEAPVEKEPKEEEPLIITRPPAKKPVDAPKDESTPSVAPEQQEL